MAFDPFPYRESYNRRIGSITYFLSIHFIRTFEISKPCKQHAIWCEYAADSRDYGRRPYVILFSVCIWSVHLILDMSEHATLQSTVDGEDNKHMKEMLGMVSLSNIEFLINLEIDALILRNLPEFAPAGQDNQYLPDSRTDVVEEILSLVNNSSSPQFIWIHGSAGIGKSTLAHFLASCFKKDARLAACVSFKRGTTGDSSFKAVAETIGYQIAHYYPRSIRSIVEALKRPILESDHATLLRSLVIEPLASGRHPSSNIPVIILDGIDEYTHFANIPNALHEAWNSQGAMDFPHILMTSRYEPEIYEALRLLEPKEVSIGVVNEGIMAEFFKDRLKSIKHWKIDGDPDARIPQLVALADGLFVWGATACNIITNRRAARTPSDRLTGILTSQKSHLKSDSKLKILYSSALDHLFPVSAPDSNDILSQSFPFLMALLMVAREPLTADDLTELVEHYYPIDMFADLLKSLQIRPSPHGKDTITPAANLMHTSLLDYLGDDCEERFRITPSILDKAHDYLAKQCIITMTKFFNNYTPTHFTDLPKYVSYAIMNWAEHACHSNPKSLEKALDNDFLQALRGLFSDPNSLNAWLRLRLQKIDIPYEGDSHNDLISGLAFFPMAGILCQN